MYEDYGKSLGEQSRITQEHTDMLRALRNLVAEYESAFTYTTGTARFTLMEARAVIARVEEN